MAFAETMGGEDLIAILQSVNEKQFTGALEANASNVFATIWLKDGQVVYARSSETTGLAEAISVLGLLSKEKIDELMEKVEGPSYLRDSMLDSVLVKDNLVPGQVISYIRAYQICETLFSILEWDKVGYELKDGISPKIGAQDLLPTTFPWLHFLAEYGPDWHRIKSRIGLPNQLFCKVPVKRKDAQLSPEETKVYSMVDGKRRAKDLVLWSGLNYYQAYKAIYSLLDVGIIDIVEKESFSPRLFQSKAISEKLQNLLKLPGVVNAFLVDRAGKMIVQDRSTEDHDELREHIANMSKIFVTTVDDFESNLPKDSNSGRVEQILTEKANGTKTILLISNSVILVIETAADVNWGLLRLSGQRVLLSVRMHLFAGSNV